MERCSSAVPGEDRGCSRQRKGLRTSRTHRKERDDNRSGLAQPRQISPVETTRSVLYRSGPLDRELNAFCQSKRSARSPQLAPRRRAGLPHVAGCGRGQFDTADAVRFASVSRALRISVKCLPNRPAVRLCRHAQLLPPSASWASRRRLCFGPISPSMTEAGPWSMAPKGPPRRAVGWPARADDKRRQPFGRRHCLRLQVQPPRRSSDRSRPLPAARSASGSGPRAARSPCGSDR
jgi:hypothetical protein